MPTVEADLPGGRVASCRRRKGSWPLSSNGQVTLENGKLTGRLPGVMLRGPGTAR